MNLRALFASRLLPRASTLSATCDLASRAFLERTVLPACLRGLATWIRGTDVYNPPILFSKTRTLRLVQLPASHPRSSPGLTDGSLANHGEWTRFGWMASRCSAQAFSSCAAETTGPSDIPSRLPTHLDSRRNQTRRIPSRTFLPHSRSGGRSSRSEMPPSTRISARSLTDPEPSPARFDQHRFSLTSDAPQLGHLPRTKPKLLPCSATRRRLPTYAARHDPRAHPRAPDLAHRIERCRAAPPRRATPAERWRKRGFTWPFGPASPQAGPSSALLRRLPALSEIGHPRSFQVDQDSPSGAFAKSYAFRKNQELSISPPEREV